LSDRPGRTGPFNCIFFRVIAVYGGDTASSCALARLKSVRRLELPSELLATTLFRTEYRATIRNKE
jgi:hypothetical protein